MTDAEFLDAIEERLNTNGWWVGRIGHIDTCNCLLGAAGFVAHGESLVVDDDGVNPISVDGKLLTEKSYDEVPGMVRLARILQCSTLTASLLNDSCKTKEQAVEKMRQEAKIDADA